MNFPSFLFAIGAFVFEVLWCRYRLTLIEAPQYSSETAAFEISYFADGRAKTRTLGAGDNHGDGQ